MSAEAASSPIGELLNEFKLAEQIVVDGKVVENHHAFQLWGIPLPHGPAMHLFGIDFSINKAVAIVILASILTFALVTYAARGRGLVARGLRNAIEAIFVFVKLDIVDSNLGHEGKKWLPFIGTIFFFILFNNLLGLIPGSYAPAGNISFTATLSIIVLLAFVGTGMIKQGPFRYWKNLAPGGVPKIMYVILYPIEFVSLLSKPLSLSLRLFANLFAGHVVIGSFLGLIIMFGSIIVAPLPLVMAVVMYAFEIFVAFIQAYIFTILTAVYVNLSIHAEH
ncbi:MAG: F0F1 ATP synthase subunit A [Firmicutes bacterium]|nr:F0F1 ATP synthase subunit A [Bacillota bacterium]